MTPRSPSSWDPCRNSIAVSHDPIVLFTGRSLLHATIYTMVTQAHCSQRGAPSGASSVVAYRPWVPCFAWGRGGCL